MTADDSDVRSQPTRNWRPSERQRRSAWNRCRELEAGDEIVGLSNGRKQQFEREE